MAETISTSKETEKTEALVAAVRIVVTREERMEVVATGKKIKMKANGKVKTTEL